MFSHLNLSSDFVHLGRKEVLEKHIGYTFFRAEMLRAERIV